MTAALACDKVADAPVAQSEEQRTFNPRAVRSKLTGGTSLSPDQLPANMRDKIVLELCPVAGLPGFCWAWTGCLTSRGYGCVQLDGRRHLTHRAAYTLLVGPIPDGLQLDHLCVNKPCCNPQHGEPVTDKVNSERTDRAQKTHCINRHPLSGDNLVIKRRRNGRTIRNCRKCANTRRRVANRQLVAS